MVEQLFLEQSISENHNNLINEHLYNRIVSHYQKLHLLYRMRNKAITVLTELENEISQFLEIINDIELARQFILLVNPTKINCHMGIIIGKVFWILV